MNGQILTVLGKIQKDLAEIKKRIRDLEPPYGSDAWWEKEIAEGKKQIAKRKFQIYKNASKLIADFQSGK